MKKKFCLLFVLVFVFVSIAQFSVLASDIMPLNNNTLAAKTRFSISNTGEAGLLSTANSIETATNNQTRCTSLTSTKTSQTYTFTIASEDVGSLVRVAMAYTVPVDASGSHGENEIEVYTIPNLDLYVYAPNNSVANWISGTTNNNVEIVEFTPTVPGLYTIEVNTVTGTASTESIYFGVAWSIQ